MAFLRKNSPCTQKLNEIFTLQTPCKKLDSSHKAEWFPVVRGCSNSAKSFVSNQRADVEEIRITVPKVKIAEARQK